MDYVKTYHRTHRIIMFTWKPGRTQCFSGMHNEACDQLGLDYTYLAFDVPEDKMPEAVQGLRTMGARGWNITMPGKNIMCKLADKVFSCI